MFRVVDLFSGCGGMSLGFQQAGFDVVAAFDNWDPAIEMYKANFDHPIIKRDLNEERALEEVARFHPDIIIGGPPCQDFSIAGKQTVGNRANLTIRFAKLVAATSPKWVVFENVYNIERYPTLGKMIAILEEAGYGLSSTILDASKCGAPQKRKRYFLVGKQGEENDFFDEFFLEKQTTEQMTVRDYFGESLHTQYYYMHPRSYARRAVFSIDEPAATIRSVNRPIPKNYKRHHGDKADVSEGVRALTTRERAMIQTFPSDFTLLGAKTSQEQAIGNAVPPVLAKFVAQAIRRFEEN
ncbi:MAG: DNA cytosine methyltransferase [Mixta calida]|uniref:DNA cytosine methyltransferase n=1 Tax=Corynebacterium glucuronolyticum TaxID=39791 RepID=UPI00223AFBC2|nr:DNA cytosine methyltransferase [Corynebacterium glucuronolyticum]MCT1563578.1 DNA cytosine methyltransferase [Corynebacterium glucuronolyticum]MDU3077545.1 DNA cytosine methyltransferase [Mixta calida]